MFGYLCNTYNTTQNTGYEVEIAEGHKQLGSTRLSGILTRKMGVKAQIRFWEDHHAVLQGCLYLKVTCKYS